MHILTADFLGYFYIEGYLHICLKHKDSINITIVDELSSVKKGEIIVKEEIIIP
jgi:hypothetical protein